VPGGAKRQARRVVDLGADLEDLPEWSFVLFVVNGSKRAAAGSTARLVKVYGMLLRTGFDSDAQG
jgi:hypothetical protein